MRFRLLIPLLVLASSPAMSVDILRVPQEVGDLQSAIDMVGDGGVIVIAAGTYLAPPFGFQISNEGRSFTIRAETAGEVVLDGQGLYPVLQFRNTNGSLARPVVFDGLVVKDGYSDFDVVAGGVTLYGADATFLNCAFEDNLVAASQTGGGGVAMFANSVAHFVGCIWSDNAATTEAGALKLDSGSVAWIHGCEFYGNRCDLHDHRHTAAGGAIHVGNSTLYVSNSRFEGNAAGFSAGAVLVLGTWGGDGAKATIANSTFVDNWAQPDASVTPPSPTEGGAVHAEDLASVDVFYSRFINNSADLGGAVSVYRAVADLHNNVWRGNKAVGQGTFPGWGGAVKVTSNDLPSDPINYRPGMMTIEGSLVQCRYGQTGAAAHSGAGLYIQGDSNRQFGQNGVDPMGDLSDNRAVGLVQGSAIVDCDSDYTTTGTGYGGGVNSSLATVAIDSSVVTGSYAPKQGGAIRSVIESSLEVSNSTLAGNESGLLGGALYVQCSELEVDGSQFLGNRQAGATCGDSLGADIFASPYVCFGEPVDVSGSVRNSVFSETAGLPIYDSDSLTSPISTLVFDENEFYNEYFQDEIFVNTQVGCQSASQLNSLVVQHSGRPPTDKSTLDNIALQSAPYLGSLHAVPSKRLQAGAVGDPGGPTEVFLVYAKGGGNATLDGESLPAGEVAGVRSADNGAHILQVGSETYQVFVPLAASPAADLIVEPVAITSGEMATLSWSTSGDSFLAASIDMGVGVLSNPVGQVSVAPTVSTTYHLVVLTEEGGAVAEATVWVDEEPGAIFADGFESGNTNAWSN